MATEVIKQYTKALAKKDAKGNDSVPLAIHAEDGENHVVGIGNIRVIICNEDGFWFAQGIDIDYAADGMSLKEVKKNFEDGLKATIGHHLQYFNGIEKLLKSTPHKVWQERVLTGGKRMRFSQVTRHEIFNDFEVGSLPYSGIEFYQPEEECAAV